MNHAADAWGVKTKVLICLLVALSTITAEEGFTSLFNGRDLSGWKIPPGDQGHWQAKDGVIDYDARSEAPGSKDLWTEKGFRDFTLRMEWRIKETSGPFPVPVVKPDGTEEVDASGKPVIQMIENADSGVYLRGFSKSQVNIWCWPIGSGEVYGYRTDTEQPPSVRAGVTPKVRADKPVGEWNEFEITLRGDRLTVILNGQEILRDAQLPGIPSEGPIGLQHHGGFANGKYLPASSLVQFRNIEIKELRSD